MHSEFSTYFDQRIAEVNAITTLDLAERTVLDDKEIPENQKNLSYILKFENFETDATLASKYIVNGIVELNFEVANDDSTRYAAIIDSYVFALVKKMRATRSYKNASSTIKFELSKIAPKNLNNFVENGTVLKPEITFEAMFIDDTPDNAGHLGAVTLLTPINGGVFNPATDDFIWQALSGSTSYDFELSQNGIVVFSQELIHLTSLALPAEVVLNPLTFYDWRVRGNNSLGHGDWSATWNFLLI